MTGEISQRQCSCEYSESLQVHHTVSLDIVKARLGELASKYSDDEFKPLVFEAMRQLLIDHPCHLCNKKSIKLIVDMATNFKPNLLCIGFVSQTVTNVFSNVNVWDWTLVRVMLGIIKDFLQMERDVARRHQLVIDFKLLSMARMLAAPLVAKTDCDETLAKLVLYLLATASSAKMQTSDYKQFADDLIKGFPLHPRKVFSLVCLVIDSMSQREAYCNFWDNFATSVHKLHRRRWQTDEKFAYQYATVLADVEKAFESKKSYWSCLVQYSEKALVEVLRKNKNIVPNRQMISFLTHGGSVEVINKNGISVDAICMFFEKITRVLTTESVKLHHEAQQFKTKATDQFEKQLRVNQSENLLFLYHFVEYAHIFYPFVMFDLRLVELLITLANYDQINTTMPYKRLIVEMIKWNTCAQHNRNLLQNGISQTIWDVITNLHDNCWLCNEALIMMRQLLWSLIPEVREIVTDLYLTKTTELMGQHPHVRPTKTKLIEAMYPEWLASLMDYLKRTGDFESLHMLAKIFRNEPPVNRETVSCGSQQVVIDPEGTKVFVLDDGTKIRAKTSPLIGNSEFFAKLLDGNFAEASLDEIRLGNITAFQFHFLVKFIAHGPWPKDGVNFDMDAQEHVDLIILCDRLFLDTLRASLVDSLRWHHMDAEWLGELCQVSLYYGMPNLRKACVDFALKGDVEQVPKIESLRNVIQIVDKTLLLEDVEEWIDSNFRMYMQFNEAQCVRSLNDCLGDLPEVEKIWADVWVG